MVHYHGHGPDPKDLREMGTGTMTHQEVDREAVGALLRPSMSSARALALEALPAAALVAVKQPRKSLHSSRWLIRAILHQQRLRRVPRLTTFRRGHRSTRRAVATLRSLLPMLLDSLYRRGRMKTRWCGCWVLTKMGFVRVLLPCVMR